MDNRERCDANAVMSPPYSCKSNLLDNDDCLPELYELRLLERGGISVTDVTGAMTRAVKEVMNILMLDENVSLRRSSGSFAGHPEYETVSENCVEVLGATNYGCNDNNDECKSSKSLQLCTDTVLEIREINATLRSDLSTIMIGLGSVNILNESGTKMVAIGHSTSTENDRFLTCDKARKPSNDYVDNKMSMNHHENTNCMDAMIISKGNSVSSGLKVFVDNIVLTVVPTDMEKSLEVLSTIVEPIVRCFNPIGSSKKWERYDKYQDKNHCVLFSNMFILFIS